MPKDFQKTANSSLELSLPHPGIIDIEGFDKQFQLRCYKPSSDLEPFVVHIWVQRLLQPLHPAQKPPVEVLSGPNMYLFFTPETAFIHSITRREFKYDAFASEVIAGVKFRPGGFYPFLNRPVSDLAPNEPLASVFPNVDTVFTKDLLSQSDVEIVARLQALLQNKQPKQDKNLELVTKIINSLGSDTSPKTVRSVAQAFRMSERSVQLLFRTYVGVGLKWIITRKRLLETMNRVQGQSNPSWAEAAAELGYSSQSHFSREFKDILGVTPSQYLKNLLGLGSRT
ncbi:MAG TPA: AraC family transcriptional regulator [Candidatus Saccharimonadales bacterium]|nr:AraC family transcriptional regulator [Candidatus Saccharimonadales bacterium]